MIETATGLVLRTRPLTESSLIVNWLTPQLGRISTVAKGARRPKSPFRGKLDLFYEGDFSFNRSRRSELHTLSEVKLRGTNPALRQNVACLRQACYCVTLVEQATETGTPIPAVYALFSGMLAHLPKQPVQPQTIFAFELRLLSELGLEPDLSASDLTPGARQLAKTLAGPDWNVVSRLKLSEPQVSELTHFLHGFLIYHLGRLPKDRLRALSSLP
jgi:DNA repair protein RecO (recombination protein O)